MTTGSMRVCCSGGRSRRISAAAFVVVAAESLPSSSPRTSCSGLIPIWLHTTSKDQSDGGDPPSRRVKTVPSTCQLQMSCQTATVDDDLARLSQTKHSFNAADYIVPLGRLGMLGAACCSNAACRLCLAFGLGLPSRCTSILSWSMHSETHKHGAA